MQLIPVLEVRHGKCVHTEKDNGSESHIVTLDPMETLESWVSQGITRVHFVDVDAIESRIPTNVDLLTQLKKAFPQVIFQALGAIYNFEAATIWGDAGADYLVLTGKALSRKNLVNDVSIEFPNRVLIELDSHEGKVSLESGKPQINLIDIARQLDQDGISGLVVTEVPSKGHVNNENLLTINEFSHSITMPLYANGGISSLADLKNLLDHHAEDLNGVLLGKVVFDESFDLAKAVEMLKAYKVND